MVCQEHATACPGTHYPNPSHTHSTCSAQDRPGAEELAPGEGSLEFDEVSYSYAAGSPVLKGVSFKCSGGQTLALVGATGTPSALLQMFAVLGSAVLKISPLLAVVAERAPIYCTLPYPRFKVIDVLSKGRLPTGCRVYMCTLVPLCSLTELFDHVAM